MIEVDSRVGSKDLYPLLQARGLQCKLTTLEFGDISFYWKGPQGRPITVGIERKTLSDLLTCIRDGRYTGHQLPGMLRSYEYVYLLLEGTYKYSEDGVVVTRRGKSWVPAGYGKPVMASDLEHFLTSRETFGGVRILHSPSPRQTAALIHWKYSWGNNKEWEDHRSHLAIDQSEPATHFSPVPLGISWRVAAQLDGIGPTKAQSVAKVFPTVQEMVEAEESDWSSLEWLDKRGNKHRLGSALGKRITTAKGWRKQ